MYYGKVVLYLRFEGLLTRSNRSKSRHLVRVIRRWFVVVVETPRVTLPPGRPKLVPKASAGALLSHHVIRNLTLKELLPGALEVALRPTTLRNVFWS